MATTYSRTREQVCAAALRHLGKLAVGETASAAYENICLERLDLILKTLPVNGYGWTKQYQGRYPFSVPPGASVIAAPTDYAGDPMLKIMLDEYRAGFDLVDSALSPGVLDTGQSWTPIGTWGISGGKLYLVAAAASRGVLVETGSCDGETGATFSTNTNADNPSVLFRVSALVAGSSSLSFVNLGGAYKIYSGGSLLKTYTVTPADGDIVSVRYVGSAITPIVNGVELETYFSTINLTSTIVGIGCSGITARFDNFYSTTGGERKVEILTAERWQREIENKLSDADYPEVAYLDPGNNFRFYPLPKYTCRALLAYQQKVADTVANTAPDMPIFWIMALEYGVAAESGLALGAPMDVIKYCGAKWQMMRAEALGDDRSDGEISCSAED